MAYALLKYDLSDNEDAMAHRRAVASLDMASFIFEVLLNGRKRCEGKTVHEIWEYLWQEAQEHNINIENLIE